MTDERDFRRDDDAWEDDSPGDTYDDTYDDYEPYDAEASEPYEANGEGHAEMFEEDVDEEPAPDEAAAETAADEGDESAAVSDASHAWSAVGAHPVRAGQPDAAESGEPSTIDESERLRQPRAQTFRRRLRNQISLLPVAIYLMLLGAYLLGRHQELEGLPEFDDLTLVTAGVLVLGFSAVVHALLFGRRERGLLFVGALIWATAGAVAGLLSIEESPDFAEWWPVFPAALAVALLLTYLIERWHDGRLMYLSLLMLVIAGTSYAVTSGELTNDWIDDAGEYWPLLLVVLGVGLLPVAFRRQAR